MISEWETAMGAMHVAFRAKLNFEMGMKIDLLRNGEFPRTFGDVLELLTRVSTETVQAQPSEQQLWQTIRRAVDYATYPQRLSIDRNTLTDTVFTW